MRSHRNDRAHRSKAAATFAIPFLLAFCTSVAHAEAEPAEEGDKVVSGMSIVGNDEAPKSLVIVPWKSSDLGDTLDVDRNVDDGRRPVFVVVGWTTTVGVTRRWHAGGNPR